MELHRGDKIYNIDTCPGIYRGNGLMTKAFGSGCSPSNIEALGLTESIRKHIKPVDVFDLNYYDVTDFLSFSSNRQRAMYWLTDKNTLEIEKATGYEETRYLFTFMLDDNLIKQIGEGMYFYEYKCNLSLLKPDKNKNVFMAQVFKYNSENNKCPVCGNQNGLHRLVLINSYEYLTSNAKDIKYDGAVEFAKNDEEWLILPCDYDEKNFRLPRIQRANFWIAEHFKVKGEKRPDIDILMRESNNRYKKRIVK